MTDRLTLRLSDFADPIAKQLRDQKFKFNSDDVRQFQRCLDAIETLYWNDLVRDTEKLKNALYNKVMRHVKKMNKAPRKAALKA